MYNQQFRGNMPPNMQQSPQHMMHQQQMMPMTSSASPMAHHQMMMAAQNMRQQYPGPPPYHQQGQQQPFIPLPMPLYPPQSQAQQMHQQAMSQFSGLPPGHIGPVRPNMNQFPPHAMQQQHQQQQQQQFPPGFPHQQLQQRFPTQQPLSPMRQGSPHMPPMSQSQNLQQTSLMNPSIFTPPNMHLQRPPPVPSPSQSPIPPLMVPPHLLVRQPPPNQMPLGPQVLPPMPSQDVPYFDLPAGLMVPLVKLEDHEYKPINPKLMKLPPPAAPSEKLMKAVEAFYAPPSHERPRDPEGWEALALSDFYRKKQEAIKKGGKTQIEEEKKTKTQSPKRRYREEKSPESDRKSRRKSRSKSPKSRHHKRTRKRSTSSSGSSRSSRSRSRSRSRSPRFSKRSSGDYKRKEQRRPPPLRRSPSPEPFKASFDTSFVAKDMNSKLDDSNKGAQLLKKMGWSGTGGLGSSQQGISDPIKETGFVRDSSNKFHGIGVETKGSDLYESYRKSRGQQFLDRIQRARDESINPGTNTKKES